MYDAALSTQMNVHKSVGVCIVYFPVFFRLTQKWTSAGCTLFNFHWFHWLSCLFALSDPFCYIENEGLISVAI